MPRPLRGLTLALLLAGSPALAATPGASHPLSARERAELLPVICRGAVSGRGCLRCPPGSAEAGQAGPLVATAVTYGHFLSARETDALVDLQGCEAHVNNFGASALLRWEGLTRWTLVKYLPGDRSGTCQVFAGRDGRDRSVCEGEYANMGTELAWLGLFDWTRPDSAGQVLSVESNLESCMESEIHDIRLTGWTRQGSVLVARVSEARARLSSPPPCGEPVKLPAARPHTLQWTWNGERFVPSAATRALLPRLEPRP